MVEKSIVLVQDPGATFWRAKELAKEFNLDRWACRELPKYKEYNLINVIERDQTYYIIDDGEFQFIVHRDCFKYKGV